MHDVTALIAKSEPLAERTRRFSGAVICPLVQGFSLLPITDVFADELARLEAAPRNALAKPIPSLPDGLHALAIEISGDCPVAYVATYYFGGQGGQDALVWDKGSLMFSPAARGYDQNWPNTPISQALRLIGVVAGLGQDEFDTVGLGQHRETHKWAEHH
jgi:hypothetical protein